MSLAFVSPAADAVPVRTAVNIAHHPARAVRAVVDIAHRLPQVVRVRGGAPGLDQNGRGSAGASRPCFQDQLRQGNEADLAGPETE